MAVKVRLRELMLVACFLHGEIHHLQGRSSAAWEWMERGLAMAESLGDAMSGVFAANTQVACRECWPSS